MRTPNGGDTRDPDERLHDARMEVEEMKEHREMNDAQKRSRELLLRIMLEGEVKELAQALGAAIDHLNDLQFEFKRGKPCPPDHDLMEELLSIRHSDRLRALLVQIGGDND